MLSSGLSAQYTYVLEQFTIPSIAFVYISNQLLLYFQLFPFLQQLNFIGRCYRAELNLGNKNRG